jgi:hypothetical protein
MHGRTRGGNEFEYITECLIERTHGDVDLFLWWSWARSRVPRASSKGFDSLVMPTAYLLDALEGTQCEDYQE